MKHLRHRISQRARSAISFRRYRRRGRQSGRVTHLRHRISQRARRAIAFRRSRRRGRASGRVTHVRSLRKVVAATAILFVVGALLLSTMLTVTLMSRGDRPDTPSPILSNPREADQIPQPIQEGAEGPVAHVSSVGNYGFTYPPAWDVEEVEGFTQLESPGGAIVVSFGVGSAGSIATTSDRLVNSIFDTEGNDPPSNRGLIGTTWERIDGSRSLIVSGMTTDATGRSVRFLAITVRGEPRNYSISVLVPARSDPTRVLPTIEAIVSSFEILEPNPEVVT